MLKLYIDCDVGLDFFPNTKRVKEFFRESTMNLQEIKQELGMLRGESVRLHNERDFEKEEGELKQEIVRLEKLEIVGGETWKDELKEIEGKLKTVFTEERIALLDHREELKRMIENFESERAKIEHEMRKMWDLKRKLRDLEKRPHNVLPEFSHTLKEYTGAFNKCADSAVRVTMKETRPIVAEFYQKEIDLLRAKIETYDKVVQENRDLFREKDKMMQEKCDLISEIEKYDEARQLPPSELVFRIQELDSLISKNSEIAADPSRKVSLSCGIHKRIKKLGNLCKCPWTGDFTFDKIDNHTTIEEFTRKVHHNFDSDPSTFNEMVEMLNFYRAQVGWSQLSISPTMPRMDNYTYNTR